MDSTDLALRAFDEPADRRGHVYSDALGAHIAACYVEADAGGLWAIHQDDPGRIPSPAIVRAWCRQYPQFALRMQAAESVRAERMMEQAVVIADTGAGSPARLALQMQARYKLAEALDRTRYGKAPATGSGDGSALLGADVQPTAPAMTDAQLAQIAAQGMDGPVGVGGGGPDAQETGGLAGGERSGSPT